jgi:hypothetical protein
MGAPDKSVRVGKVVQKLEKTKSPIKLTESFQITQENPAYASSTYSVDGQNTLEVNHALPCTLSAAY